MGWSMSKAYWGCLYIEHHSSSVRGPGFSKMLSGMPIFRCRAEVHRDECAPALFADPHGARETQRHFHDPFRVLLGGLVAEIEGMGPPFEGGIVRHRDLDR